MAWHDDAWDWAKREIAELKAAKTGALALVVLGGIGGWYLAAVFYAERIEVLQLQVDALAKNVSVIRQPEQATWPMLGWATTAVALFVVAIAFIRSKRHTRREIRDLQDRIERLQDEARGHPRAFRAENDQLRAENETLRTDHNLRRAATLQVELSKPPAPPEAGGMLTALDFLNKIAEADVSVRRTRS